MARDIVEKNYGKSGRLTGDVNAVEEEEEVGSKIEGTLERK